MTNQTTIDLPVQTRADARLQPLTIDEESRTIEMVWSTGATVRRRNRLTGREFDEQLSLEPQHVDLSVLNAGAPLLNAHSAESLQHVIGVVERAWIAPAEGDALEARALVRFSQRADVEPLWQDVRAGIIRNVSVGYVVRAFEIIERDDSPIPTWRAIDWQPLELSAVPIGADQHAHFRERQATPCQLIHRAAAAHHLETDTMDQPTPAAETRAADTASTEDQVVSEQNSQEAAIAGERARIAGIYEAARKLNVESTVADEMVRDGVTLADARGRLINARAAVDAKVETRPHIRMTGIDERETRRGAIEAALLHRYSPALHPLSDAAREWRGMSLMEIARATIEAEGVRTRGLSRTELVTRAMHTTSDFPFILAAVAGKTLRAAYEAAPRTFQPIARRVSVPDFKAVQRTQLGEAPQLEKVLESGEFKRGTIGEAKETYAIATWGKVVAITRQTIINDDLDAFTRLPAMFGQSAATLESDTVWGIVTANAAMADNVALFHATHANLTGTGTALSVASLGVARTLMSKQKGLDGTTILNVRPAFLAVPSSLELTAEQIIAQNLTPTTTAAVVPASIRSLVVLAEPRLDPASGAVPWYLFANPATIDTIEYAYLEGNEGVFIDTRVGFDVDGVEVKARLDFGAKAIDWRGMYKNAGV